MTPYPSDLTDQEWQILEPLIPPAKPGGRPRSVEMRAILNGMFYLLRSGCAWRLLPHEYPPPYASGSKNWKRRIAFSNNRWK